MAEPVNKIDVGNVAPVAPEWVWNGIGDFSRKVFADPKNAADLRSAFTNHGPLKSALDTVRAA